MAKGNTGGCARPAGHAGWRGVTRRGYIGGLAAGAAVAACGPLRRQEAAGGDARARQPVTLQWQSSVSGSDQTRQRNWDYLLDQFQARHPQITVQRAYVTPANHYDKVVVGFLGGSMPDLFSGIVTRVQGWAAKGIPLVLEPYVKRRSFDLADFAPQSLQGCTFKGKLYLLPQQDAFYVLLYNRDLFDQAGLPHPGEQLKWADLVTVSQKMTRDSDGDGKVDRWGMYAPSSEKHWITALWSHGAAYMDAGATRFLLDRPEAVAALQLYLDLWQKYHVAPSPLDQTDMAVSGNDAWATGRMGMYPQLNSYFALLRDTSRFRWDIAVIPEGPGGRGTPRETIPFGIGSITRDPEEAWLVLDHMTSSATQKYYNGAMGQWPARKSAMDDYVKGYPKDQPPASLNVLLTMERRTYARAWPVTTNWIEISGAWGAAMRRAYTGETTVAGAMAQLKPEFERFLAEHQQLVQQAR